MKYEIKKTKSLITKKQKGGYVDTRFGPLPVNTAEIKQYDNSLNASFDRIKQKVYKALPEGSEFLPGVSDTQDVIALKDAFGQNGTTSDKLISVAGMALPFVGAKFIHGAFEKWVPSVATYSEPVLRYVKTKLDDLDKVLTKKWKGKVNIHADDIPFSEDAHKFVRERNSEFDKIAENARTLEQRLKKKPKILPSSNDYIYESSIPPNYTNNYKRDLGNLIKEDYEGISRWSKGGIINYNISNILAQWRK